MAGQGGGRGQCQVLPRSSSAVNTIATCFPGSVSNNDYLEVELI